MFTFLLFLFLLVFLFCLLLFCFFLHFCLLLCVVAGEAHIPNLCARPQSRAGLANT